MALHLEDHRLTVADIDDACVLTGAADHLRAFRRQGAEPFLRGFVGAMLIPHRRKNAELGEGRNPPANLQYPLILVRLQPVFGGEGFVDFGFGGHGRLRTGIFAGLLAVRAGRRKRLKAATKRPRLG